MPLQIIVGTQWVMKARDVLWIGLPPIRISSRVTMAEIMLAIQSLLAQNCLNYISFRLASFIQSQWLF